MNDAAPRTAPRLVTLEGGEGAGKSTVLAALRAELERGSRVTCTREPGGTPLGEKIRGLLLDPAADAPCDLAELLLMFAARAQLVRDVVKPALDRGDWVLSDRFTDASHAYQGGGRGCDPALIDRLEHDVVGLRPGLTLLLDVPVEVGLARARGRGGPDRIEAEQDAFFERVRLAYLDRATADPARFVVLDATRPAEDVATAAVDALRRYRERLP
ncbi:dTMP kinase [Lysobacter humi (ex Lee et al. 2017)]